MIKTLRITSVLAGVCGAVLLILPAVFGVRSDAKIEEFLKSAGAVDNFLAAKGRPGAPGARDESQTSPLVKQAMAFALYLNPPPPPPPKAAPAAASPTAKPAPPAPVTPKFNLIGTSFYAARPELSLALIDEPGKGLNWVRQGNTVGYLTIEQIKDGSIIIKDSQGASEMTVLANQPWRTLLKNPPPETQPVVSPTTGAVQLPPSSISPPIAGRGRPGFGAKAPSSAAASQKVVAQPVPEPVMTEEPEIEVTSPAMKEQEAKIERVFDEISAISEGRITGDEAAKLDELSKLVEQLEEMRVAGLSAMRQPEPPDQADANASPDANQ